MRRILVSALIVAMALFGMSTQAWAQAEITLEPVIKTQAVRVGVAPRIEELAKRAPTPKAYGEQREVHNYSVPEFLLGRGEIETKADPLAELQPKLITSNAPAASLSFPGYSNQDNAAVVGGLIAPPDVNGDVGPNFYVQYINLGWVFFNKSNGSIAGGPFAGNIFWQGFGGVCDTQNAGDPIVLYDHLADRWVFSQFTDPGNPDGHQCFAVTQGSNPAGPYFLYDFIVSPGEFNDYPKIGIWTDGAGQSSYVMTSNNFQGSFSGAQATSFERDAMLAGGTAQAVAFKLSPSASPTPFSLQPAHLEGPAAPGGTCPLFIQAIDKQTWGGTGSDGYQFWELCNNWGNPNNATFAASTFVNTTGFDAELCGFSRNCIPQPGTSIGLDTLGQFTMYRFQNRFINGDHLAVINHTVDTGGNVAGIRWAQFDITSGSSIAVADTGTLAPGDGISRWVGSIAMDGDGNIGLSYTRGNASNFPSVYFTGRETTDPAGTLQAESVCVNGTGSQLGTNRWVDYSSISVDPVDNCTFWLTNEYVETTGNFAWDTRVCSFKFPSCGQTGGGADFEAGAAVLDQATANTFATVNLTNSFTNPRVVAGPPSFNGAQPTAIRLNNVTGSSFGFMIEEWDYLDETHITETTGYLVLENGAQTLGGLAAEAGSVNTNQNWVTVNFSQSFGSAPVVVAQAVTYNGNQAITTRIRNVTTTSFQVRVQEEEGNDGTHATETIHWIAMQTGTGVEGATRFVVGRTGNSVTDAFATVNYSPSVTSPILLADMQTFDGGDTAALRHQNLTGSSFQVKVEEEQSANTEVAHTTEVIGYIIIGR